MSMSSGSYHFASYPVAAHDERHDCREYLEYQQATTTESHGERFTDEWWECCRCHSKWTERDLELASAA